MARGHFEIQDLPPRPRQLDTLDMLQILGGTCRDDLDYMPKHCCVSQGDACDPSPNAKYYARCCGSFMGMCPLVCTSTGSGYTCQSK